MEEVNDYTLHNYPQESSRVKKPFTLIELILSLALMSICLATVGLSLSSYMKKRSFLNDIRFIQAYFDDAARLARISQHEVDIMLFRTTTAENTECVALSLLLWGAPANDVKRRLETPALLSSIGSFTIEGDKGHNASVNIGGTEMTCIRFFPREIHEDFHNVVITFSSLSGSFQEEISLSSVWDKTAGNTDPSKEPPIPDAIAQEALGEIK